MNPYEWIKDLYKAENLKSYMNCTNVEKLDPHCYKIAARALDCLKSSNKSQSILVCGESGSGKTESAKCCLDLLVKSRMSAKHDDLPEQIISVNPILESFGNAKTTRNNNSSRFGKFTKILYTDFDRSNPETSLTVAGCKLESYLLEKSRVISHEPTERNFHIFYFIFKSKNKRLELGNPSDFYYLAATKEHAKSITLQNFDDAKKFNELKNAVSKVGLGEDVFYLFVL